MAKIISGLVNTQGEPAEGDRYVSSVISQSPWAVVVTYKDPFDRAPVAMTSVSGSTPDIAISTELQSSNTSLAIYTNSADPLPLFFFATDRGL